MNLKNQNFEKMKKIAGDILHMSTANKNHLPPNSPKTSCYETQFLRYKVRQLLWAILCPLPPFPPSRNNPEDQNFEKMEKASGDVINLNLPNKKHDQMMYAYSDMECDSEIQFLR